MFYHSFKSPKSYRSPPHFIKEANLFIDKFLRGENCEKFSDLVISSLAVEHLDFILECSNPTCDDVAVFIEDGKVFCENHSAASSKPIIPFNLRCRHCNELATSVDFDFVSKTPTENFYINDGSTIRSLQESTSHIRFDIFLCDSCCKNENWKFSNSKNWIESFTGLLDQHRDCINYLAGLNSKIDEIEEILLILLKKADYAEQLIIDATNSNAKQLGKLINSDIRDFNKNYPFENYNGTIVSRFVETDSVADTEEIDQKELSYLKHVRRILIDATNDIIASRNEIYDSIIAKEVFLEFFEIVFKSNSSEKDTDNLILCLWLLSNFAYLGLAYLNSLFYLLPQKISEKK